MKQGNGSIVFLGDSLTEWFDLESYFPDQRIDNMGIAGDTSAGILYRLDRVIRKQPEKLFLMIGINDIFQGYSIREIINNQQNILDSLMVECPNSQIFVQSLLPVNEYILGSRGVNDKVKQLNQLLKEYCQEAQMEYIALNEHFLGRDGLNPEFTYDGAHLSGMGYRTWAKLLGPYLKK
ncbi:MAG: hypothetical protein KKA81_08165 [Bacteroidetes bacterium]|nr:hypothetical protein [Bacteroidota bacterium]